MKTARNNPAKPGHVVEVEPACLENNARATACPQNWK